ncbi:hypothetical protein [Lysinibacillus fusiformis]
MDLLEDLNEILNIEFEKMGYRTDKKDTHGMLTAFFNLQDKTISIKRRSVHISKELREKNIEEPYESYLKQIRNKFKNGKDINPHLSKMSVRPYQKDLLLYDWGIHHLHVNNNFDDKGFIERSDYILFFIINEDNVYFIDVTKHKLEDRTEFSQQNLLRIVKRNWPHLLTSIKGITGEEIDDKEYKELRDGGAMSLIKVDGEVFAPMGGGYSTAKTSIVHTQKSDQIVMSLRHLEEDLKTRKSSLKEYTSYLKITPIETDFKLVLEDKTLYIIEINSGNKIIEAEGLFSSIFGHLV